MDNEKFLKDTKTVLSFIDLYCKDKHETVKSTKNIDLVYNGFVLGNISYSLCKECEENFLYSYHRLQECPHEVKPRCRHCKDSCYERPKWKALVKVMKYSGMKMGLTKVKNFFKRG